jgi:hypothetical protein
MGLYDTIVNPRPIMCIEEELARAPLFDAIDRLDITAASYDRVSVTLLTSIPDVTDTPLLPPIPPLTPHNTAKSDSHTLRSHAEMPTRPLPLHVLSIHGSRSPVAMFKTYLDPPTPAPFVRSSPKIKSTSNETMPDTLAATCPTVIAHPRLP